MGDPTGNGALFEQKGTIAGKMKGLTYMPSVESSERITIDMEMDRINQVTVHPNGKTIAFHSILPSESKVWVMENFLPVKK